MEEDYNPIHNVDGIVLPAPSKYVYNLYDVSKPDAGRLESGDMNKGRLGQCVKLQLTWQYATIADTAKILQAFNPEYITIEYLDACAGKWMSAKFYVGDRAVPLYNSLLGRWESITFTAIDQKLRKDLWYECILSTTVSNS